VRIELPDGQWAELRDRITHAQDKELKRAIERARANTELWVEVDTLTVRTFVRDWFVKDPDGNAIPPSDGDAVERAPADIVDTLYEKAAELYTGATDTNPTLPSSEG
jgi:hypothetical protein